MLGRLFHRRRLLVGSVPDGAVVYAVGDIHGRADLLRALLQAIVEDATSAPEQRASVVFLGDYVDRGADSKSVIDQLIEFRRRLEVGSHFIRGNHDQTLLDFLEDPTVGPSWLEYGGRETLVSYGVEPPAVRAGAGAWEIAADALAQAMPLSHVAFFRATSLSWSCGDYFFCHAGARAGTPLERQTPRDLMWLRHDFLDDDRQFDKVVVHGHTPAAEVHSDARRIGVDTGAYATNILSAVRLENAERSLIQARGQPGGPAPEISRGVDVSPAASSRR